MKKKKWEKRDEAMCRLLDDLQLEMTLNIFNKKKNIRIIFNEQLYKNNLWIILILILYNYE